MPGEANKENSATEMKKATARTKQATTPKAKRYLDCSICRTIPDRAQADWIRDELLGDPLPKAESRLMVVGAPFFVDRHSHSHSCLKQCPECDTFYGWDFSYEYLVHGSEDEVVLTRLSDAEGQRRARAVFTTIEADETKFRAEAVPRIDTLLDSPDGKGVYGAAYFLQGGQMRGHDVSFAIHALVKALVRFSAADEENTYLESCASLIYLVLSDAVKESPEAAGRVLDILESKGVDATNTELKRVKWLIADCRKPLATG